MCATATDARESPTWFTLTTPWPFLDPTYRHRVCEADGIQPVTEVSLNDQHHLIWGDVCVSCAYPVARGLSWGEPGIGMSNSVVKAQEVITPATPAHLSTNGTKRSMRKAFFGRPTPDLSGKDQNVNGMAPAAPDGVACQACRRVRIFCDKRHPCSRWVD